MGARVGRTLVGLVAGCLVAPALLSPLGVMSASAAAGDYPSWSEVEQAEGDAAATAAESARIAGLLDSLDAEAAGLGDAAVLADAAAATARAEADAAARTVADLRARAASAADEAAAATRQAGAITARLSRGGDPALALWLAGDDAESTLQRLASMGRVTETLASLRSAAEQRQAEADALSGQARSAAASRDSSAVAAEASAVEADRARDAADARLAEAEALSSTLYAQLAALNDTSAQLEQEFREGQALQESYAAGPAAGPVTGGSGSTGAPGGGGTPPAPSPPPTTGSPGPTTGGSLSPGDARAYAAGAVEARGWGSGENQCLVSLWNRESGWRWNALNPSSGAYGIPQSLPGSKMASAGDDWRTNAATQIEWGLGYISSRYGTPCGAWAHSERIGWY